MARARENDAVIGRSEILRIDPTKVKVVEGWNPRSMFDAQKLEELKDSIKENGVLQPIRVKLNNSNEFILIDGERRLRATLLAISEGAEIISIPAIVERKTMNEIDMLTLALTANQGEPLTMVEEAKAMKKLMNYGLSQDEVARKLGKSQMTVSNRLRLLDASPEVLSEMEDGNVSFTDVLAIVDSSDGIESQKQKLEETKAKKKARKENKEKVYGKKDFVELVEDMIEWLVEFNKPEPIEQVTRLLERANKMLDNKD